jgi:hypothetical protein
MNAQSSLIRTDVEVFKLKAVREYADRISLANRYPLLKACGCDGGVILQVKRHALSGF